MIRVRERSDWSAETIIEGHLVVLGLDAVLVARAADERESPSRRHANGAGDRTRQRKDPALRLHDDWGREHPRRAPHPVPPAPGPPRPARPGAARGEPQRGGDDDGFPDT